MRVDHDTSTAGAERQRSDHHDRYRHPHCVPLLTRPRPPPTPASVRASPPAPAPVLSSFPAFVPASTLSTLPVALLGLSYLYRRLASCPHRAVVVVTVAVAMLLPRELDGDGGCPSSR